MTPANPAPVALFAFRRPAHLRRTLEALASNCGARGTHVYAFVDSPSDAADQPLVDEVCQLVQEFDSRGSFAQLVLHRASEPKGLARSVVDGLSLVLAGHDRVIGLEDDIVLAPGGLSFLNDALDSYANDHRVWSISAYSPELDLGDVWDGDVYFTQRASSWGYATWKDRWAQMNWDRESYERLASDRGFRRRFAQGGNDLPPMLNMQLRGEIDSWAVRWCARQAELGLLTAYPVTSLVHNSGQDGSGTHSPMLGEARGPLGEWRSGVSTFPSPELRPAVVKRFRQQFVSRRRLLASRIWRLRHMGRRPSSSRSK